MLVVRLLKADTHLRAGNETLTGLGVDSPVREEHQQHRGADELQSSSLNPPCPNRTESRRLSKIFGWEMNPREKLDFAKGDGSRLRDEPEFCSRCPPYRGGYRWRSGEGAEDAPGKYDTSTTRIVTLKNCLLSCKGVSRDSAT